MAARARRGPGASPPVNWTRTKVPKTPPPATPTRRGGCGLFLLLAVALVVLALALTGRNR